MRRAEERRSASMMISSSIRWSLAGKRGRLDDEHVLAAHVFLDLDEDFHVGEAPDLALGQRDVEIGGDRLGQRTVGISRNELHETIFGLIIDQEHPPRDVIVSSAARRTGLSSDRKPSQYADGRQMYRFSASFSIRHWIATRLVVHREFER